MEKFYNPLCCIGLVSLTKDERYYMQNFFKPEVLEEYFTLIPKYFDTEFFFSRNETKHSRTDQ